MPVLLTLVILAATGSPDLPAGPPAAETRPPSTWVFFKDKGPYSSDELARALTALSRTAPLAQRERRQREPTPEFSLDDLPVRETYVRQIEAMGGRLRSVSNWLNAASFELPAGLLEPVSRLPFVREVKPVVSRSAPETDLVGPLPGLKPVRARAVDTADAHRFYGPSYDQAQMMGVPEIFFRGFFGSGIRLAIFDTGLKLENVAVKDLRILNQHDFLSGDRFYFSTPEEGWVPAPAERLQYLGLVKAPAMIRVSGSDVLLLFVADSFAYGYGSPRRAIYVSRSSDSGNSWATPDPVVFSMPASQRSAHTFENLDLAQSGSFTYLVYNDLSSNVMGRPSSDIYLGRFVGTEWNGHSRLGSGRWPAAKTRSDTLFVCYVENDSTIVFRKAWVGMSEPSWVFSTTIRTQEPHVDLELAIGPVGEIAIIGQGQQSGGIFQHRSTDGGASFLTQTLAAANAYDPVLESQGARLLLFYKDAGQPPFIRLSLLGSDDFGQTWTSKPQVTDSTLSVGGFAAGFDLAWTLTVLYETGGMLYERASPDQGSTWSAPRLLDTAGFCYTPAPTLTGAGLLATWVKRGDDNTVWEASDTARFSLDQPDHGTRMASLIAGYQQGGVVGIAPGVDLLIGKTELYKTYGNRYYEYNLEEDTYIEALEWAERLGADIVSTSLGYRGWYGDDQFDGKTAPISVATALAAKRGLIIVTAMGNRDTFSYRWPTPYITAPADADGVIAAGGVERDLRPWRGTGTGPTSDGRIKPELVALSDTVAVAAPDSVNALDGSVGTSCATALIAGCCALLKEAHPNWSSDSIKQVLFETATGTVQNCTFGYGVPRIDSAFKYFPPDTEAPPVTKEGMLPFPNPFVTSEHDRVYFALSLTRPTPDASISIFSASGTLVDTIPLNADPIGRPGRYDNTLILDAIGSHWDGKTAAGKPAASGLYLAVLNTTFGRGVAKFALVR